jgi:hypothetical protein
MWSFLRLRNLRLLGLRHLSSLRHFEVGRFAFGSDTNSAVISRYFILVHMINLLQNSSPEVFADNFEMTFVQQFFCEGLQAVVSAPFSSLLIHVLVRSFPARPALRLPIHLPHRIFIG